MHITHFACILPCMDLTHWFVHWQWIKLEMVIWCYWLIVFSFFFLKIDLLHARYYSLTFAASWIHNIRITNPQASLGQLIKGLWSIDKAPIGILVWENTYRKERLQLTLRSNLCKRDWKPEGDWRTFVAHLLNWKTRNPYILSRLGINAILSKEA